MADDGVANDVDGQYGEESETKIAVLQRERNELVTKNTARKEEIIMKLTAELNGSRGDVLIRAKRLKKCNVMRRYHGTCGRFGDGCGRLNHRMVSEMNAVEEVDAGYESERSPNRGWRATNVS